MDVSSAADVRVFVLVGVEEEDVRPVVVEGGSIPNRDVKKSPIGSSDGGSSCRLTGCSLSRAARASMGTWKYMGVVEG